MSKTLLRLIEDATVRYGTDDIYHSTTSRMCSAENISANRDEVQQLANSLAYMLTSALKDVNHENAAPVEVEKEEKYTKSVKNKRKSKKETKDTLDQSIIDAGSDMDKHSIPDTEPDTEEDIILVDTEDIESNNVVIDDVQEPKVAFSLDNKAQEESEEVTLSGSNTYNANIWDD